ncbi:MAG: AraC family transcriptional regulator [Lachnospiraceae bacterium]|nr:AraC family transcriptional regulator [Lachnospiraceae bacterium]
MEYESIELSEVIHIERIVTIHYFEYMKDFCFPGESHDFWEFQCVDKGTVRVLDHTLKAGQVIFHKPNEFHDLAAYSESAPNVVVVSFVCHSPVMKFFENRIMELTDQERNLIGMIISEARRCIKPPFDDPYLKKMEKREDACFGSEQFIRIYLESLLLVMIRRNLPRQPKAPLQDWPLADAGQEEYGRILEYLKQHLCGYVTIEDICRENLIGRSQLQKLFREKHGCGVIDYFTRMKVEYAKQLIREQKHNFTQISELLGYSSIHYFSRRFKKVTGMTPSEYMASIKAMSEYE